MTALALAAIGITIAALSTLLVRMHKRRSTRRKVERVMRSEVPYTPSISLRQSRMYATRDACGDVDGFPPMLFPATPVQRSDPCEQALPELERPRPDEGSALLDLGATLAMGAIADAIFSSDSASASSDSPSLSSPDSEPSSDFSGDGGGGFGGGGASGDW